MNKKKIKQIIKYSFIVILILVFEFALNRIEENNYKKHQIDSSVKNYFSDNNERMNKSEKLTSDDSALIHLNGTYIPSFDNEISVKINNNEPFFEDKDKSRQDAFEEYSQLDSFGRCGTAYANICTELMPTEKRGEIGHIKPSGWKQAKYEGYVNSNPPYLYNRCHLIAFCLAGENDNKQNLITGTRYFNTEGMLPYETEVLDYVKKTKNHVLYRVTPIFNQDELVARGVLMEAYSVEDQGKGVSFCVFVYNVQPNIIIDYKTGSSCEQKE